MALDALNSADRPAALNIPGLRFHALSGDRKGQYSLTISRNWRMNFRWSGKDAIDVDLEDYHG